MSADGGTAGRPARWARMTLARALARHLAVGFIAATVFVLALLQADPGGLGGLLQPARSGAMPLALLWLFTGLTFTGGQFALAPFLPEDEERGGGGLSASPGAALRLARVPALARAARPR
ncbi:hypothetical protein E2C05_26040, partial [Paracraurococcus ruber]|uniref:hypothetical protein n=1 Tax=Paracraurococcus ruber TaxID=77675 RepID=UPI001057FCEF